MSNPFEYSWRCKNNSKCMNTFPWILDIFPKLISCFYHIFRNQEQLSRKSLNAYNSSNISLYELLLPAWRHKHMYKFCPDLFVHSVYLMIHKDYLINNWNYYLRFCKRAIFIEILLKPISTIWPLIFVLSDRVGQRMNCNTEQISEKIELFYILRYSHRR